MCCSAFYPFIEAYLKNFFTREVINDPNLFTFYDKETGQPFTGIIKDPDIQFSEKNIRKIINDYCLNPDNRFKSIILKIEVPNGKETEIREAYLKLKGNAMLENNISTVINREMTITDLLYLACVETCEHHLVDVFRHGYRKRAGGVIDRVGKLYLHWQG